MAFGSVPLPLLTRASFVANVTFTEPNKNLSEITSARPTTPRSTADAISTCVPRLMPSAIHAATKLRIALILLDLGVATNERRLPIRPVGSKGQCEYRRGCQ